MLVATKRAPARTAADARSSRSKSKVRCQPTTTASAGPGSGWPASTTSKPFACRASTTPGPLQARIRAPGARPAARRSAGARARGSTPAAPRPLVVVIRLDRRLPQGVLVGLLVGPHDGGHLKVPPSAGPVADPQQAQAEPEVGVVVHRVEFEHLLELRPGLVDPL